MEDCLILAIERELTQDRAESWLLSIHVWQCHVYKSRKLSSNGGSIRRVLSATGDKEDGGDGGNVPKSMLAMEVMKVRSCHLEGKASFTKIDQMIMIPNQR